MRLRVWVGYVVGIASLCAVANASHASSVQGYANGYTLIRWCGSEDRLDAESCIPYLRGVFDSLEAMPKRQSATDYAVVPGVTEICVPRKAPIHQLQFVVMRYLHRNQQLRDSQGAVIVIAALREQFPCAV